MTDYKGYKIVGDGSYGFKEIKPEGKGSVPKELRGKFTHAKQAHICIDSFLAKQPPKAAKKEKIEDGERK
jgi:hypothetical protein